MKAAEARELIRKAGGYCVHFDRREGSILSSDYFPDRDEPSIADLDDAWLMATQFATVNPDLFVNVYVVHRSDWTPVDGYRERRLNIFPAPPSAMRIE